MLIIPDLQIVLILVPRTGSGTLKKAVKARYPNSILLYRHMEADGVPAGYDRWEKIGIVRDPFDRLWSLFKVLRTWADGQAGDEAMGKYANAYVQAMRDSVDMSFSDWIVNNQTVFTSPYDSSGYGNFYPHYTVRHPLPENRKSQYHYLRPDLGTTIYPYSRYNELCRDLDIKPLLAENVTDSTYPIGLSKEAEAHMQRWFAWDSHEVARLEGMPFIRRPA